MFGVSPARRAGRHHRQNRYDRPALRDCPAIPVRYRSTAKYECAQITNAPWGRQARDGHSGVLGRSKCEKFPEAVEPGQIATFNHWKARQRLKC
jgi:hypothetical protein